MDKYMGDHLSGETTKMTYANIILQDGELLKVVSNVDPLADD